MTSLCLKQQSYESNYFLSWAWSIQYFCPDQLVTDVRLLAEWPMFLPFKEEKEIEISYSHSQELPLTFVEFSPPFNINSDRNISKFYWIWKLFTFKLSEVTIINTTSFNVDSKKKNEKYNYIIRVEIPQLKTCPPPSLRVCGLCFHSFQPVSDESLKPLDCKCTQLLLCCHTKTSLWKIIRGNKRKWLVIFCLPRSYNEETAEYL